MSAPAVAERRSLLCRELGCDAAFTGPDRALQLVRHEAEDHAEPADLTPGPEWPCEQCREGRKPARVSFAHESGLDFHQALAHGPMRCLAIGCRHRFEQTEGRRLHMQREHRDDQIACAPCGDTWPGYLAWTAHQKQAHPFRRRPKAAPVIRLPLTRAAPPAARKEPAVSRSEFDCRYPGCPDPTAPQSKIGRGVHERTKHGAVWGEAATTAATGVQEAPTTYPLGPGDPGARNLDAEMLEAAAEPIPTDLDASASVGGSITYQIRDYPEPPRLGTCTRIWYAGDDLDVLEAAAFLQRATVDDLLTAAVDRYIAELKADEAIGALVELRAPLGASA